MCPDLYLGPACSIFDFSGLGVSLIAAPFGQPISSVSEQNFYSISQKPTSKWYYYQVDAFPSSDGNGGWLSGSIEVTNPSTNNIIQVNAPGPFWFAAQDYKEMSIFSNN